MADTAFDLSTTVDPQIQALIDKYRQQQYLQQLAGAQEDVGSPKNVGEGINAIGKGFVGMLRGFQTANAIKQQQAMGAQLGNIGPGPMMPFPSYTPSSSPAFNALAGGSSLSPGGGVLPTALQSTSPIGKGPVQAAVADRLRQKGLNETAIAGIMGNIQQESGFNPTASGDQGRSVGLFQHLGARKSGLLAAAPDLNPVAQVDYMAGEFGGPNAPNLSVAKLNSLETPAEVAVAFGKGFERPSEKYANWAGREKYANQFAQSIGPASHGVPPGMVAGPGVPSDVEPTTQEGRLAAMLAARKQTEAAAAPPVTSPMPPPRPADLPNGPLPSPGGGGPGAAAELPPAVAAPPVTPPPTSQVAPPPVAVRPPPPAAPVTGGPIGSAYDPRTGRFLAPGEKIPGYAPAPMSSTGGGSGLLDALAGLFGGGAVQAAPVQRSPAMAVPAAAPAGLVAPPPSGRGPGPSVAGVSPGGVAPATAAPQYGDPLTAQMASAYQQAAQQAQMFHQRAQYAAGTPYAAGFEKQAEMYDAQKNELYKEGIRRAEAAQNQKQFEQVTDPATGDIHGIDPRTGRDLGVMFKGASKEPASVKPGDYVRDPFAPGGYRQVGEAKEKGGSAPPTAEDIQKFPWVDEPKFRGHVVMTNGKPEVVGEKLESAGANATLMDREGKPIDPAASGPELMEQLSPEVKARVQGMLEGRFPFPAGYQMRNPTIAQAAQAASMVDPTYNQGRAEGMKKLQVDAESPKGLLGASNIAMNKTMHHSATLADAAQALANGDNPIINAITNKGAQYGTDKAKLEAIRNFNLARDAVANEAGKAFHGVGATALSEINRQIENVNVNDPPAVQLGAITKLQELLHGQLQTNEDTYREGVGQYGVKAWESQHGRDFGFLQDRAKADMEHVGELYTKAHGGGSEPPKGEPAVAPSTQPTPQGPPANVLGLGGPKPLYQSMPLSSLGTGNPLVPLGAAAALTPPGRAVMGAAAAAPGAFVQGLAGAAKNKVVQALSGEEIVRRLVDYLSGKK